MKTVYRRIALIVAIIMLAVCVLAACDADDPRLEVPATYSPGAPFQTNFNDPDPRRQLRCTIIFEVIDETAIEELAECNFKIRNSILAVLGSLKIDEIAIDRDLVDLGNRIVERVNADLAAKGDINLIVRAYFTEFQIV